MANKKINKDLVARRYAQALFDLAVESKKAADIASDLHEIIQVIDSSDDLANVINSPIIPRNEMTNVMMDICDKMKVSALTKQFIEVAGSNGRINLLPEIVKSYDLLLADSNNEVTAIVTSAVAMTKAKIKDISTSLSKATGKIVKVQEDIDESIISGLRVTIGSQMLDASLSGRLERMELHLKNNN